MHDVRVPPVSNDRIRLVYQQSAARLWRSVQAFSSSRDIADEAVAEAFAQALRRGDKLRDPEAWVWRTAFALARGNLQRRGNADVSLDAAPLAGTVDPEFADLRPLMALSESDREVLVLRYLGGYEAQEIARICGISAGAVRVRLHRARARARRLMEEGDGDE